MQFIPGVFSKALLTDAEVQIPPRQRLGSGYQRSKTGGRAGGPADRKMENNADDCERTERGAVPLSRKESWESETLWVNVWSRAGRQIAGERGRDVGGR